MFTPSKILRGISPFSLFIMRMKGNEKLAGLTVTQRGTRLGKMYRALTGEQKSALKSVAAKTPAFKRVPKKPRAKRVPTAYNTFFRKNFAKATGAPKDRVRQIAKLWKAQQRKK